MSEAAAKVAEAVEAVEAVEVVEVAEVAEVAVEVLHQEADELMVHLAVRLAVHLGLVEATMTMKSYRYFSVQEQK